MQMLLPVQRYMQCMGRMREDEKAPLPQPLSRKRERGEVTFYPDSPFPRKRERGALCGVCNMVGRNNQRALRRMQMLLPVQRYMQCMGRMREDEKAPLPSPSPASGRGEKLRSTLIRHS